MMGLLPKGQLTPVAGEILLEGEDLLEATPSAGCASCAARAWR